MWNRENVDCGDSGEIYLNIDDNGFISVSWSGSGCFISSEFKYVISKINDGRFKIQDLRLWSPAVIYDLLGVKISQGRVNCALLSYKCLENALKKNKINRRQKSIFVFYFRLFFLIFACILRKLFF